MFQRFHAMKERREGGFTLIELLVVILIIAILAAIAIPVFLNQRKKGWVSQMESAVKNAATAAESYATGQTSGTYTGMDQTALQTEGWKYASAINQITVSVTAAPGDKYCINVGHTNITGSKFMAISSDVTAPTRVTAACASGLMQSPAVSWTP